MKFLTGSEEKVGKQENVTSLTGTTYAVRGCSDVA